METEGVKTRRVLVVDDEPEVTFALQAYFLGKGYEMLTALDGLQAMRYLHQHAIDLVLLDMKMPGVNGVEVLKFIRAKSPSTKVIVVTAYDVQFQEMVEQLGVDGFLIKPFGIEALTSSIQGVLAGRPQVRPEFFEPAAPTADEPLPKAGLLFVEPSEYTYKLKEVFFSDPEKSRGTYRVSAAYSTEEALHLLESVRPDILLVDLTMLGPSGELAVKAMASPARPKELIIHGPGSVLPSSQNAQVEDLSRRGVKIVYNESFTRAGLIRLGEVIRRTAIAHGLVGNSP
ncbi:MAG: response regulator [Candidatus Omnitrophica bacterium]|nr:response regulator [Candidatus Omnitrophota bacterium]